MNKHARVCHPDPDRFSDPAARCHTARAVVLPGGAVPRAPKKCAGCETRVVGVTHCPACKPAWKTSTRPGSTRASRKLRAEVLDRDRTCTCPGCPRCTTTGCTRPSTEDDHIHNLAAGGTDSPANHAGKCSPCHRWKTLHEAHSARP